MSTSDCSFERSISTSFGKLILVDCQRKLDDAVKLCKEHLKTELACIKDKDTIKVVQDNIESGETFLVGLRVNSKDIKWEDGTTYIKKEVESLLEGSDSESNLDDIDECKDVFLKKEKKNVFRMRQCNSESKFFCLNSTTDPQTLTPQTLLLNSTTETNSLTSTQPISSEGDSNQFYLLYGTVVGITTLVIVFLVCLTIKIIKKKKNKQILTNNEVNNQNIENQAFNNGLPSATLYGMTSNEIYNQ